MAQEESQVVQLCDDFYRDSFGRVVLIIASICIAISLLVATSVYLYLNKPPPITFSVDNEWRVQPPVPLDQPYLATADLLQWVSDVVQRVFVLDFIHYNDQLKASNQYFTPDGWNVFLNQLNSYANYNNVQAYKMFINSTPAGAPFILNQGLLSGRYAWWVQIPIKLNTTDINRSNSQDLALQILVVRVPTLNNLMGVGIDNVIVAKSAGGLPVGNSGQ